MTLDLDLDVDIEQEEPDTGPSAEDIPTSSPARQIGEEAEVLDREGTIGDRMRLPASTLRRLALLGLVYVAVLAGLVLGLDRGPPRLPAAALVALLAFALETADSAAGMGMGTGLAPLLFVLGYEPLQVVPVLLVSETLTGVVGGAVHDNVDNVSFAVRPPNDETRLLALLVGFGAVAVVASVLGTYLVLDLPPRVIKTYVAVLVLAMGVLGLLRARLKARIAYRPRRLAAFVVLAGVSKGIGGGGYGPVVTLGQILSGVYEKSAVAITTMAEGLISIVGVGAFLVASRYGVALDMVLLVPIFAGGFLAAIAAPYAVRVLPNAIWRYAIPLYAVAIGVAGFALGVDL